ncbi:hypothetical protein HK100_007625 [Physocladia obscura]|uniref:SEC7 domain-containing protein n=1 Tax=Physocladia obscura TaxID=109957 RepID=A0AAD5SQF2_9FUNG|nr:hypothetical protein HK100_007625 [Physocladia obscura]
MERLSALLQRKEQELLLEREREAAGNSGASTLELKLKIQKVRKYNEEKAAEKIAFELQTEKAPQVVRANVLGVLARRVKAAQEKEEKEKAEAAAKATATPAAPETANKVTDFATPVPPITIFHEESSDLVRKPSIYMFMASDSLNTFNNTLSKAEVPVSPSELYKAIDYIRIKSGMTDLGSPERESPLTDSEIQPPPTPAVSPLADLKEQQQYQKPPSEPRPELQQQQQQQQQQESLTLRPKTPPQIVVPSRSTSRGLFGNIARPITSMKNVSAPANLPMPQKDMRKGLATLANASPHGGGSRPPSGNSRSITIADFADEFNIPDEYADMSEGEDSPARAGSFDNARPTASALASSVTFEPKRCPDRTLLKEGPAWTIATISSLKEAYLFLFEDILVITKPYERRTTKRMYFKPLTIMNLRKCTSTFNDIKAKHPNNGLLLLDPETRHKIETVVSRTFESHPVKSISYFISKGIFPRTPSAVATFLLTTPNLPKVSLGKFLALQSHTQILVSYLRFLNFQNRDLLTSFRMLLCYFRLPTDESDKVDAIVNAFVERWLQCNPKSLAKILPPTNTNIIPSNRQPIDFTLANLTNENHWQHGAVRKVVFGLLALDFEVHYALSTNKDEAIFQYKFISSLLPVLQGSLKERPDFSSISSTACEKCHRDALIDAFESIVREQLDMGESEGDKQYQNYASKGSLRHRSDRLASNYNRKFSWGFAVQQPIDSTRTLFASPAIFTTTTPFLNLTVNEPSPIITLSINQPVPGLQIEVNGVNIRSEPEILDFTRGTSASFTVTGVTTGRKVLLFTRRFVTVDLDAAGEEAYQQQIQQQNEVRAARGLENPAGLGILVEPAWLKYRFAVEEGSEDTAGNEINAQVLAVSTEESFDVWERILKRLLAGNSAVGSSGGGGGGGGAGNEATGLSKNIMALKGNNPYGTLTKSINNSVTPSAVGAKEREKNIEDLKEILLDVERPLSKNELMRKLNAVSS